MKQRLKNQNGTTLVELIVCMVLLAIFTLAAVTLIQPSAQAYMDIQQQTRAQNLADALIETIRGEVLKANGYIRFTDGATIPNDTDEDNNKDNEESSFDENSEYNKCLNLNNDGMMGYISIPKIDVKLPIYHSTDNEVLQKYVGHLEGSSLPVGGKSTHGVLAAHRGLPSSRLFTDLDRIEEGDRFYIYVLNQVLTYQVDRIYPMIDKNDKAKLTEALKTKEGEDYITLLTCTPYGVNTHRLLVRGKRVENSNESYDRKLNSNSNLWILGGAAVGIIATSVVLVILIRKGEKAD